MRDAPFGIAYAYITILIAVSLMHMSILKIEVVLFSYQNYYRFQHFYWVPEAAKMRNPAKIWNSFEEMQKMSKFQKKDSFSQIEL